MKISICKDTITLAKLEEAKEFAQDNSWRTERATRNSQSAAMQMLITAAEILSRSMNPGMPDSQSAVLSARRAERRIP